MSDVNVPVLLVDDRPANLLALEALLESRGYELVSVLSGREAVEATQRRDFAVVLLDVMMPDMDGFATARAMARLQAHPTPIIFVTGIDSDPSQVREAYAAGAVDFVQKPLDPLIIRSKVAVFAELYRTRLRLRASEARFHQLVDAVTDYAIFMLDETGHVATWNPGAQKNKGYEAHEILGRHFSVFYTAEDRAAGKPDLVLDTVRREGRFEDESWRVRKDGTHFWANVVITALRDPEGKITGFAKVTRDLTARRAAEESRAELAREQLARDRRGGRRRAVRFTPTDGQVAVTCARVASGMMIRVRDTGTGIAAEHLPHIFERFNQIDSATTRSHGGLGLGLAIVRHLVDAHGGSVEAESEGLGRGATFTVTLPIRSVSLVRAQDVEAEVEPKAEAQAEGPDSRVDLRDARVLVVDDDPDSVEVLGEVLELAGAQVTTATNAQDAFEAIEADGAFTLIVSDIAMPEEDGYAFIRRVRSSPAVADLPAIALTAYARATDAALAIRAGYQEHLVKPVDQGRLLRAVQTWSRRGCAR